MFENNHFCVSNIKDFIMCPDDTFEDPSFCFMLNKNASSDPNIPKQSFLWATWQLCRLGSMEDISVTHSQFHCTKVIFTSHFVQ